MARVATTLAVLLMSVLQVGAATPFPGQPAEVASPTRSWVLRWIPADQTATGEHALVLINQRSGAEREVLSFPRHVTAAWAPDGQHFVVVNFTGSTDAESSVYSVEPGAPVSVAAILEAQQPGGLSFTRGADHLYVEAVRWLDSNTLSVRVWGYGGGRGFDRRFRVRLNK